MVTRSCWLATFLGLLALSCDKSGEKTETEEKKVAEVDEAAPPSPALERAAPPPAEAPAVYPSNDEAAAESPAAANPEGDPGAAAAAEPPGHAQRVAPVQAPLPGDKTKPHPGHCDPTHACPEGQGCSGLFFDASGQCIPVAEAKAQCGEAGGEWGTWGAQARVYCMRLMKDGGKSCTDGNQCEGDCIQEKGDKGGKCQKYEIQHGCYSRLSDGKAGMMLCVD